MLREYLSQWLTKEEISLGASAIVISLLFLLCGAFELRMSSHWFYQHFPFMTSLLHDDPAIQSILRTIYIGSILCIPITTILLIVGILRVRAYDDHWSLIIFIGFYYLLVNEWIPLFRWFNNWDDLIIEYFEFKWSCLIFVFFFFEQHNKWLLLPWVVMTMLVLIMTCVEFFIFTLPTTICSAILGMFIYSYLYMIDGQLSSVVIFNRYNNNQFVYSTMTKYRLPHLPHICHDRTL